jgi:hypothetical protein
VSDEVSSGNARGAPISRRKFVESVAGAGLAAWNLSGPTGCAGHVARGANIGIAPQANEMKETIITEGVGRVDVSFSERGAGQPVLLMHGGGGPASVTPWADLLAAKTKARVVTPTHPGLVRTPRPEALTRVGGLARVYAALIDKLGSTEPPSWATRSEAGSPRSWVCGPARTSEAWCSSTRWASKSPTIPPRTSSAERLRRPTTAYSRSMRAR